MEDVLEPDLPICDPHHHLWDQRHEREQQRYLLDEILDDVKRFPEFREQIKRQIFQVTSYWP